MLVEECDFIAIAHRSFTFASLARETVDHLEPPPFFGYRVAAVLTFKGAIYCSSREERAIALLPHRVGVRTYIPGHPSVGKRSAAKRSPRCFGSRRPVLNDIHAPKIAN